MNLAYSALALHGVTWGVSQESGNIWGDSICGEPAARVDGGWAGLQQGGLSVTSPSPVRGCVSSLARGHDDGTVCTPCRNAYGCECVVPAQYIQNIKLVLRLNVHRCCSTLWFECALVLLCMRKVVRRCVDNVSKFVVGGG